MPRTGAAARSRLGRVSISVAGLAKISKANSVRPCRPHQACDLRESEMIAERHPERVPRKSGQHGRTQPFRNGERKRESEDAAWPRGPKQARAGKAQRREAGEHRGKTGDAERQGPGELLRIDEESRPQATRARRRNTRSPPTSRFQAHRKWPLDQPADQVWVCFFATEPSSNQTDVTKVIVSEGDTFTGASERAPTAPASSAMARRLHPQDEVISWIKFN